MVMKKIVLTFTLLAAIAVGCAPKPALNLEPTPDINVVVATMMSATLTAVAPTPVPPTDTPAPTPTPTELPPGTLNEEFAPDFVFPNPGWSAPYDATDPTGVVKHNFAISAVPDFLQFDLFDPETYLYAFYEKEMPADVMIDADYLIKGSRSSEAAVVCRMDPKSRTIWYEFRVDHFKREGIIYYFNRKDPYNNPYEKLKWAPLPVELFFDKENRIRAICKGNKLTMIVNDVEVISVEDTKLPGAGLVGMGAFVHKQIPLNVSFNKFHVSPQ